MPWYYAPEGRQVGPFSSEEFGRLIRTGEIRPETMVWRDGFADWVSFGRVSPDDLAELKDLNAPRSCAGCGLTFPDEDLLEFEKSFVCGSCKEVFLQGLKEGLRPPEVVEPAGFWIRAWAKASDMILIFIAHGLLYAILINWLDDFWDGWGLAAWFFGTRLLVNGCYSTFMIGRFGATLGKMGSRIIVVDGLGRKPSYRRAAARFLAELVSAAVLWIGYAAAAFDPEKRALHDRICNTRVIRK